MTRTVSDVMGECYEANDPGGYDPVSLGDAVSLAWDAVGQRIGDAIILDLDEECGECGGAGEVATGEHRITDLAGHLAEVKDACPTCDGTGRIPIQYVVPPDRWEAAHVALCRWARTVEDFAAKRSPRVPVVESEALARIAAALIPNLRRARFVGTFFYYRPEGSDPHITALVTPGEPPLTVRKGDHIAILEPEQPPAGKAIDGLTDAERNDCWVKFPSDDTAPRDERIEELRVRQGGIGACTWYSLFRNAARDCQADDRARPQKGVLMSKFERLGMRQVHNWAGCFQRDYGDADLTDLLNAHSEAIEGLEERVSRLEEWKRQVEHCVEMEARYRPTPEPVVVEIEYTPDVDLYEVMGDAGVRLNQRVRLTIERIEEE